MTGSLDIRPMTLQELGAYKTLRDQTLLEYPEAFTSDAATEGLKSASSYRSRLDLDRPEGGHFTLGAWRGTMLVGTISCGRDPRIKARHIGLLLGLMVSSDCAGQGIGRALLRASIEAARAAEGLEMLILSVTASNAAAVRLYQRFGFERYSSLPRAIRIGDAYHTKDQMRLQL